MSRHPTIPPELRFGPFHRETALRLGLTRHQLESPCWTWLLREVYCLRAIPLTNHVRLKALRLAVPPGTVVTGRTAAWLYGAWLPPPGHRIPLDCAPGPYGRRFSRAGVNSRRLTVPAEDIVEVDGLLVTSAAATCFGLMVSSDIIGAVEWADAFRYRQLLTDEDLRAYSDRQVRRPNVRMVRLAVDLSSDAAESPPETRMRMVLVVAGCPEPYVNRPIRGADGKIIAKPDISYLDPDLGLEYDGSYHLEGDQPERDNVRENKLLVLGGMPLLRYGGSTLRHNPRRIVTDVVALRPDFLPLCPLDIPRLLVTGYKRAA